MNSPDYKTTPSKYPELTFAIVDDSKVIYDIAHFDNVQEVLERVRKENPCKTITATYDGWRLTI